MLLFLKTRLKRLLLAFKYSWQGFGFAFKQKAFQEELLACCILLPLALWLDLELCEKILLIGSLIGILVTEIINTAIEASIDRISQEKHPLAGMAKDLASSAVLLSILWAAVVWVLILWK